LLKSFRLADRKAGKTKAKGAKVVIIIRIKKQRCETKLSNSLIVSNLGRLGLEDLKEK